MTLRERIDQAKLDAEEIIADQNCREHFIEHGRSTLERIPAAIVEAAEQGYRYFSIEVERDRNKSWLFHSKFIAYLIGEIRELGFQASQEKTCFADSSYIRVSYHPEVTDG